MEVVRFLAGDWADAELSAILRRLEEDRWVLWDREQRTLDFHPVVRRYVYMRLEDKLGTHARLVDYFRPLADAVNTDQVKSVADLVPVIELYHHTVRAGRYDEAFELYLDRFDPQLYELGAYQTIIEFLGALFPEGEERGPQLESEAARARTLRVLATAYSLSGNTRRAVTLFERELVTRKRLEEVRQVAVVLRYLARVKVSFGNLLTAERDLHEGMVLCRESGEDGLERGLHRQLGILLTYEGRYPEAELEMKYIPFKFRRARQSDIAPSAELSLHALLLNDLDRALSHATYMRRMAYKFQRESDIIRAEWLLGILRFRLGNLPQSQRHLNEAVVRCRRINMVELEPDILLAWARWHRAKGNPRQARRDAEEALRIANRCEYRLKQADIHNFLARAALDKGDRKEALKQAEIAKERAWCDGPPHCYKPALEEAERILESCGGG